MSPGESCGSISAPRPASARPTPCSTRATGAPSAAPTWSSASSRPTAGSRPRPRSAIWRSCPGARSPTAAPPSRRWTSTPCSPAGRTSRWSTSSPTPTSPAPRNAKRWQDVEELLDAGIDVISTVNIQHLESLNDVVEKITGVPQRETVPDAVVRAADQVELVDMTPEALRRRMAHGNVYRAGEDRRGADQLLPHRQPGRAARAGPAVAGRPGRRGPAALPRRARHHAHLGGPRAGRGRADRRARGRDADPAGRPDRRPLARRRPARRARHPHRRADRRPPRPRWPRSAGWPSRSAAATTRSSATTSRGAARLRPRRERHPAGARRQPPLVAGVAADRPRRSAPGRSAPPATSTCTSSPTRTMGRGRGLPRRPRRPAAAPAAAGYGWPSARRRCSPSLSWRCAALNLTSDVLMFLWPDRGGAGRRVRARRCWRPWSARCC